LFKAALQNKELLPRSANKKRSQAFLSRLWNQWVKLKLLFFFYYAGTVLRAATVECQKKICRFIEF
jgi:hypothetical protein